jgi:hypothetical protein
MLILTAVIAAGTPDIGIAQTMSFSQPVTVLRGQPATTSNQANQTDQSTPTDEAPYPNNSRLITLEKAFFDLWLNSKILPGIQVA